MMLSEDFTRWHSSVSLWIWHSLWAYLISRQNCWKYASFLMLKVCYACGFIGAFKTLRCYVVWAVRQTDELTCSCFLTCGTCKFLCLRCLVSVPCMKFSYFRNKISKFSFVLWMYFVQASFSWCSIIIKVVHCIAYELWASGEAWI